MFDFFDMVKLGMQLGIGFCVGYNGLKIFAKSVKLVMDDIVDWLLEKYCDSFGCEDDETCN